MASKGLLSRVAASVSRLVLGRERVGVSPGGITYYKQTAQNDHGEPVEKRWVAFPPALGHGYYEPDSIPPEWNQWLKKVRQEPPSDDDILRAAERRDQIRQKAAALQEEEARRRFQAEHLGQDRGPSRDAFMRQLTEPSLARGGAPADASSAVSPTQQPAGGGPAADHSKAAQQPPSQPPEPSAAESASLGTRKGAGQDFQPEAWRPGG